MSHSHKTPKAPISPKFGWKKDNVDVRDKILKLGGVQSPLDVPTKVDLREYCSRVENQYHIGSCTANSVAGALEFLDKKEGSDLVEDLSRLFVYYNTRALENNIEVDSGGTLRSTIKALAQFGTCNEDMWSYNPDKFTVKPDQQCYDYALKHTIAEYHRIDNFNDMLRCLASGYPFVFGFMTYSEFSGLTVASTGVLGMPGPTEICQGGHAVCAVGYDMDAKTILVRNSWGEQWGQGGYFTMPFAYISNPNLAADMWCVKKQA